MSKYLVMIFGNQADYDAMNGKASEGRPGWSQQELQTMFKYMESINNDLAESGEFVDGQGLAEPRRSVVVTAGPNGAPVVSDGPYGETREVLAGYWVLDCASIERVTEIAKRVYECPLPAGTAPSDVVVRPIDEAPAVA